MAPLTTTDPRLVGLPTGLSAEQAASQFEELQKKLVSLWQLIESFNQEEQTIVVVPSITLDIAAKGSVLQAY